MKIIKPYYKILTPIDRDRILKNIEFIGRTCYRSHDRTTKDSASKFVRMLIKRGHEGIVEHLSISCKFVCDRAISHQIVRTRMASHAQESQRFVKYDGNTEGKELVFIQPLFYKPEEDTGDLDTPSSIWQSVMSVAEHDYLELLNMGLKPEEARSVLPNSTKTELIMTANLRSWRHFLKLRTEKASDPAMRQLTVPLLKELQQKLPEVFEDI